MRENPIQIRTGATSTDCICFLPATAGNIVACAACSRSFHGDCVGVNFSKITILEWTCDDCLISSTLKEKLRRSTRKKRKPKKSSNTSSYIEIDSDSGEDEDDPEPMDIEEAYKISKEVDEFMKSYDKFLKELIINYQITAGRSESLNTNARLYILSQWIAPLAERTRPTGVEEVEEVVQHD